MKKISGKNIVFYLIHFLAAILIGLLPFLLVLFLTSNGPNMKSSSDGALFSGIALALISLIIFAFSNGYLNFVMYGFSVIPSIFSKSGERKYKDLHDYNEQKNEGRKRFSKTFLCYLIVAAIYLIVCVICYAIWRNSIV